MRIVPTKKRAEAKQEDGGWASERIDKRIAELDDWRGETLGKIRALINPAGPDAR